MDQEARDEMHDVNHRVWGCENRLAKLEERADLTDTSVKHLFQATRSKTEVRTSTSWPDVFQLLIVYAALIILMGMVLFKGYSP